MAAFIPGDTMTRVMPPPPEQSKPQAASSSSSAPSRPDQPDAPRLPAAVTICGNRKIDPYYGMNDPKNPSVISYLEANNQHAQFFFDQVKPLKDELYKELLTFVREDDQSVPLRRGDYFYYRKEVKGAGLPIYCRRKGSMEAKEEILFDCNVAEKDFSYFKVKASSPSPDGRYYAMAVDTKGTQHCDLWILDTSTGKLIQGEVLKNASTSWAWCNDSKGLWYATYNDKKRTDKVHFHSMGSDPSKDPVLFVEDDELFDVHVYKSLDDRFAIIHSGSKDTSEVYFAPVDDPKSLLRCIQPRVKGLEYSVAFHGDNIFVHWRVTGENHALAVASIANPDQLHWGPKFPADPKIDIDDILVLKDYLVVCHQEDGLVKVVIHDLVRDEVLFLPVDDEVYDMGLCGNIHFDSQVLRYYYSSPLCPLKICEYDMLKGSTQVLKQQPTGGLDPKEFVTERKWIAARDGVKVPVTLLHKKGISLDGNNPLFAYAYGSYGVTIDDGFTASWMCMAKRGVVCALVHPRGGGYLGPKWYEEGKLLKKKNTFYDFIDCVDSLVKQGYSQASKVAIQGGSAGGLLMGAVLNERPDLFGYVHAAVPFVDVMTTMLDDSLPLTTQEWIEWGNPKNKEEGDYMLSYSPYDNVRAQNYPTVFITGGLHDEQVGYWEPTKWCAKLRDYNTGKNPIILQMHMSAGHHSHSGRYAHLEERAEHVALMLHTISGGDIS